MTRRPKTKPQDDRTEDLPGGEAVHEAAKAQVDVVAVPEAEVPVSGLHTEGAEQAEIARRPFALGGPWSHEQPGGRDAESALVSVGFEEADGANRHLPQMASSADPEPGAVADGGPAPSDPEPRPAAYALKITGPRRGRRRAGIAFGADPVVIQLEDLSADQATALQADPMLKIEVVAAT